ncbi:MAG: hypothetical protein PSX36_04480 [bacterium]|nr:hypothetical protein [bacterium]
MKRSLFLFFVYLSAWLSAQENPLNNPVQTSTDLQVQQLIEKKAEYHHLTNGEKDGYRIKIHFGIDRDAAEAIRLKFDTRFPELPTYLDYQQPNFVILVGDYKTKLEAFESVKKIQSEFPTAFIVKGKIKVK